MLGKKIKKVLLLYAQMCIIKIYNRKGAILMAKTANLYARIEPEVKEKAENIIAALGIPDSNAINMFYKQIILQRGLPFELKLPLPDLAELSAQQLDEELAKGYADVEAGRVKPAAQAFAELRRDCGL